MSDEVEEAPDHAIAEPAIRDNCAGADHVPADGHGCFHTSTLGASVVGEEATTQRPPAMATLLCSPSSPSPSIPIVIVTMGDHWCGFGR